MVTSPLFSIIIPTRNRAHLLPNALRSALNQSFDDFEIIITANHCTDNTRNVVAAMATNKVRYFEHNTSLSAIDNWEFGWKQAIGKYVIFLSDDDALVPNALRCIAENALKNSPPIVCWQIAFYFYPDWKHNAESLTNTLLMFFYDESLISNISTKKIRKQIASLDSDLEKKPYIPIVCNCAINREYLEEWRQRLGHIFFPAGDSFPWLAVHIYENIVAIHRPLTIKGIHDQSVGSYQEGTTYSPEFLQESSNVDLYAETQIPIPLQINLVVNTFLRVSKLLAQQGIKTEPIDIKDFYLELAKKIAENKDKIPNWHACAEMVLQKIEKTEPFLHQKIYEILSQPTVIHSESMRDIHRRTQKLTLESLSNITRALNEHSEDIQSALCVLALQNELLVDPEWSHMYLFGEKLHANNIYTLSTHLEHYYELLLNGRRSRTKPQEKQNLLNQLKDKIKNYVM